MDIVAHYDHELFAPRMYDERLELAPPRLGMPRKDLIEDGDKS